MSHVLQSSKFQSWKHTVEPQGVQLEKIEVIVEVYRRGVLLTALIDYLMKNRMERQCPVACCFEKQGS